MCTKNYFTGFRSISILSFILLLFNPTADAQNDITFKGRVLDSATNQPIPFATIEVPKSGTGVVTNEHGEFNYHIPQSFENERVQISCLGYKKIQFNVAELKQGVLNNYKLEPEVQQLPEIEIKGMKGTPAVEIVNKAIRNIGKNYPKSKTLLYGYYRDYISAGKKDKYKNLTEAALILEDKGFNRNDFHRTRVKLEQLRYNPHIAIDSALNGGYDGKNKYVPFANIEGKNELSLLRLHDPIRNHSIRTFSYVNVFDWEFVHNHQFTYESITEVDSSAIYCINFETHRMNIFSPSVQYWVNGQIYIQSQSYAILKFTYTVYCTQPSYNGRFFDLKLEYKNFKGKYYLNYLSLMNYFEYKDKTSVNNISEAPKSYYQYRELFINKIVKEPFES
ncbi:MAG TPA: hypothetical protein DCL77_18120, partial [Prolixibacteraceae bacterium]|nr:hypothetical protein [Prolixibacteraceae bacterium]